MNDKNFEEKINKSKSFEKDPATKRILGIMRGYIPITDADELVKHGKWIKLDKNTYQCSKCLKEPQGRVMTDYCPNCGAKMDGGNGDL